MPNLQSTALFDIEGPKGKPEDPFWAGFLLGALIFFVVGIVGTGIVQAKWMLVP